jgi:hypothetical protein
MPDALAAPAWVEAGGYAMSARFGSLLAVSQLWGVSNRHWLANASGLGARWQAPGPVCSLAVGMGYAFGSICNQSFLVWVRLNGTGNASGRLIGSPVPGWADGFRTQAQFQTELYVAFAGATGTLFVLDRWNCLLREVSIPAVGDYRTQSYTVAGLTTKFAITGEPRCYGPGSLAYPRHFYSGDSGAGRRWFFVDDNSIWQLDAVYRQLSLVGAWPAPDGLSWLDASNPFALRLALRVAGGNVSVRTWVAQSEPCPADTTSLDGGECAVPCAWGAGHYVDPATGACVACQNALQCPLNQTLVPCNRTAQAYCAPCPPPPAGFVYTSGGVCTAGTLAPTPPCQPEYYQSAWYCVRCPLYTVTLLPGAVRVEQCKCLPGFVRSFGGSCSAPALYAFPASPLCASGTCRVPGNASVTDFRTCAWACRPGYYQVLGAGFWDSCQPCAGIPQGRRATTAGDPDMPLSCEFA